MAFFSLKKKGVNKTVTRSKSLSENLSHLVQCSSSSGIDHETITHTAPQSISPSDLCNQLKDSLPLQLTVTQGMYGYNPATTFVENDQLTAHFIQSLEYVLLQTPDGKLLRIPINSSVSASTIYNPTSNLSQAMNGFVFPTIDKVMMQPVVPKFVAVVKDYIEVKDIRFTVEANDVLFIVGSTKLGGKKVLKCIHAATGLTKYLRNEVRLSTRPENVLVPLKTLLQYICGPAEVLVLLSRSVPHEDRDIIGVLQPEKNTCLNLLCTRSKMSFSFCAIPESLDLDLQHNISDGEHDSLCVKTAEFFQHFDLAKVEYDNLCLDYKNEYDRMIQLSLYDSILYDKKENSITFPNRLRKFATRSSAAGKLPQASIASIENRVALLEETMQTLLSEMKLLNEKLDRVVLRESSHAEKILDTTGVAQAAFDMANGKVVRNLVH